MCPLQPVYAAVSGRRASVNEPPHMSSYAYGPVQAVIRRQQAGEHDEICRASMAQ